MALIIALRNSRAAQAVLALQAFNRRFRLIRVFGEALSIHLPLGFLIAGVVGAGVVGDVGGTETSPRKPNAI
jgi:hypothetical protein